MATIKKSSISEHRLMTSSIRVQQLQKGQLIVSVPGALATALEIKKGDEMVWKLDGGRLYLEKTQ